MNEGLALLNENTTRKVKQLIKSLLQEGHIDDIDMTTKWLSLTPNPLRIPTFDTLNGQLLVDP